MARLTIWWGCLCYLFLGTATYAARPQNSAPAVAWLLEAKHTPQQPRSGQPVEITATVQPEVKNLTLEYQIVEPGAYIELKDPAFLKGWTAVPMQAKGAQFQATLPGETQKHRRLIRYRFSNQNAEGKRVYAPSADNVPPNYAYFVYAGVPAWSGAVNPRKNAKSTFSSEAMRRIQVYHLIGNKTSIENVTWNEQTSGKEYKYTGTLVVDGEVFDHVGYRARGGVWRYAMGKNMWKFSLPGDHLLHARDDFGRPYPVPWSKVNLRACIQQGDYGQRGEQGMFESVGFRMFNLAGVAAPNTHWIQLRIIDEPEESPRDQYRGDFWGLYLAIEDEDGHFLKTHGLPNGNLYKMENGTGFLEHQGTGQVTNRSDLHKFKVAYLQGNPSDEWWRTNVELATYFSYRAICECIHHYDIGEGKNYDYYHNPQTERWQVIPWDIDLTWADNMYGSGEEPFKRRVLSHPAFRLEYQNRLREIRDLLFNPEQMGPIIDEYAAVIWDPSGAPSIVEADRRKWDFHPVMATSFKAGQGLFYEAAPNRDFPGMVQLMKDYVKSRSEWVDAVLLKDSRIPETPSVTRSANVPADQLRFRSSAYKGASDFAAMKWRLAQIGKERKSDGGSRPRVLSEITPVWESAELTNAVPEMTIPAGVTKAGHTYRVRVRVKDVTGRWSHWSAPVEFTEK